jgi:hypothetical protein
MDADEEYIRKSRLIQYVCERDTDTYRYTEAQTDTRTTTSHDDEDYEILRHPHIHTIHTVLLLLEIFSFLRGLAGALCRCNNLYLDCSSLKLTSSMALHL